MQKELMQIEYQNLSGQSERFTTSVISQIKQLVKTNDLVLGVEIEGRVKSLLSIEKKLERSQKKVNSILDLDDFIRIRVILLFKRDVDKAFTLIRDNFKVIEPKKSSLKLNNDELFGYQSDHVMIKLPKKWLDIPTLKDLAGFRAKIEVRTLSQHIWGIASHKLQYKQENNVPLSVKRSINRVSSLLEVVDLEFERVLVERESYKNEMNNLSDTELNVDSLEALCDELLPAQNKDPDNEDFSRLIKELYNNKITTIKKCRKVITKNLDMILKEDRDRVKDQHTTKRELERANRGVFFTHVGLIRICLHENKVLPSLYEDKRKMVKKDGDEES